MCWDLEGCAGYGRTDYRVLGFRAYKGLGGYIGDYIGDYYRGYERGY